MIYKLKKNLQGCSHGKFNHIIDKLNVNCDLGNYEPVEVIDKKGNVTLVDRFKAIYTSAVIAKKNLVKYSEDNIENVQ